MRHTCGFWPTMFVPGHQVHSDIAAAKEGVHATRRRLAVGKVKEGRSSGHGSSRFPSGCPGPCLVSGCRVRPGLHLGLGGLFSVFVGTAMSSRVVQSLASVRATLDPFCTGSVEDSLVTMGMENRRQSVGPSTQFPILRQCISCQANLTSNPPFPRPMNPSKTRSDSA